jgi:hypothetical protein
MRHRLDSFIDAGELSIDLSTLHESEGRNRNGGRTQQSPDV